MKNSTLQNNLDLLKEISEANPATTHIIFRRDDDSMVDIPVKQAEFTARQHPTWQVEDGAVPKIELAVVKNEELPVIPPRPSEGKAALTPPVGIEKPGNLPIMPPLTPDVQLPPKPKAGRPKKLV